MLWTCEIQGAQYMICMKKPRFSSRPRAKVRRQRPLGSARVQPCHLSSVCYLTLFSFVFHSTVLYLSSLLISLPYSLFLLSFILLFYVLSPPRLPCRGNLTLVSNVCEGAPRSLVGPPTDATNYRKCVSNFPSTWLANRQWPFFNRPIMTRAQILVHSWRT